MQHRVLIAGITGKMGREVVRAVGREADMDVVGGVARHRAGEDVGRAAGLPALGVTITSNLAEALERCRPDVLVDFTSPDAVWEHAKLAARASVRAVIGTSGLTDGQLSELDRAFKENELGAVVAPNFALGAVLMTHFAKLAAAHFPDAEIVEYHHDQKKDAPSGTALLTVDRIAKGRSSAARSDVPVHSVRLPGFVAHQEVIFGASGQTLSIRHDTTSRESFMPGVIMGVRKVQQVVGVVYGLESLLL